MSNKKFDAFVNKQISQKQQAEQHWEKRREEWLSHVQVFFNQVQEFLHDYVSKGQIEIVFNTMKINEEYLGEYEVQEASIFIGKNQIVLKPIGTLVIGASGRIDMKGACGTVKFVLTDKNITSPEFYYTKVKIQHNKAVVVSHHPANVPSGITGELVWKISTPPPIKYQALTQESFLECLMEVTNG